MHKKFWFIFYSALLLAVATPINAAPWFTGPILAPAGKVIPLGHANFEMYGFYYDAGFAFDDRGRRFNTEDFRSYQANPIFSYGLTDSIDAQVSVPFSLNYLPGRIGRHVGDTSVLLGLQLLRQEEGKWPPNARVTLQGIIPTGKFDGLNPTDKGTGVTGAGAYENVISLNLQELLEIYDEHYLRTRLSLSFLYSYPFGINGYTAMFPQVYARGRVNERTLVSGDLAFEYTLTQHWVAVMEGYIIHRKGTIFMGVVDANNNNTYEYLKRPDTTLTSLSPAIEYNFTDSIGIIAGYWFAVQGRTAPDFKTWVVALNISW